MTAISPASTSHSHPPRPPVGGSGLKLPPANTAPRATETERPNETKTDNLTVGKSVNRTA